MMDRRSDGPLLRLSSIPTSRYHGKLDFAPAVVATKKHGAEFAKRAREEDWPLQRARTEEANWSALHLPHRLVRVCLDVFGRHRRCTMSDRCARAILMFFSGLMRP